MPTVRATLEAADLQPAYRRFRHLSTRGIGLGLALMATLSFSLVSAAQPEDWKAMRERMIGEIRTDFRRARTYIGRDSASAEVIEAVARVPRHRFVPEALADEAYRNHPLPIGDGQTISQPFIVALMTDLLEVGADAKVMELGTGSGYQAAVLAELVHEVYTVEIVEALADRAEALLRSLGYSNVHVRHGDGTLGWPDAAPFDGIIVTAAGIEIPQALIDQLRTGARMVMPVGSQSEVQRLMVLTKLADGSVEAQETIPVRFVPITDRKR